MNQTFTTFTILQHDESAQGTRDIIKRMTDLGVRTIFATTDNQSDSKVHLHVDVKTHPILETVVILQKYYLMVNELALS
ncbi:SIS domain-containing protein, partial [Francisella tularensis subsp. holarctica]|nr:SIS domain-containing protein [Francisella tularensis subsp. holarctica]